MIYSGQCGDDLTWSLQGGTLTVTGTGDMWDFWGEEDVPWQAGASLIETVCLEQGVSSVGNYAFRSCTNLTSVMLPDSLTNIGEWSFNNCTSLPNVTIPSSVDTIEGWAFGDCHSLTCAELPEGLRTITWSPYDSAISLYDNTLTLPQGLTLISAEAFAGLTRGVNIIIPNTVTEIEDEAFVGSNVTILGKAGSYAEKYCRDNAIPFMGI